MSDFVNSGCNGDNNIPRNNNIELTNKKGFIHCCLCGTFIEPNDVSMCIECIRNECLKSSKSLSSNNYGKKIIDNQSSNLLKSPTRELIQCKKCLRWQFNKSTKSSEGWIFHELESTGLLTFCLKQISELHKYDIKIIDSKFIWTEPHSNRIKIAVDVIREILNEKVKINEQIIVNFEIKNKQCADCIREAGEHTWGAMIQIRQHVGHKRSFYLLEQLITSNELHHLMTSINMTKEGIDFYFKNKSQADKVSDFIVSNLPVMKSKSAKKLISKNIQSNISKCEHVIYIELIPLCKGDLVVIPKELNGGVFELMLVSKLSSNIHFINPTNKNKPDFVLSPNKYFVNPFSAIMTSNQLSTFVILDNNNNNNNNNNKSLANKNDRNISTISDVEVVRESDLGNNDDSYIVSTHLSHLLNPGDQVLGYDIAHSSLTSTGEDLINSITNYSVPDIVLVRKTYPDSNKIKRRNIPKWINNNNSKKNNKDNNSKDDFNDNNNDNDYIMIDNNSNNNDSILFCVQQEDELKMETEEFHLFNTK